MQSIPVPNQHSGADYLLLHFWGPRCLHAGPIQILKIVGGRFCIGTPYSEHIRNGKSTILL
jgi:hypothetical protein